MRSITNSVYAHVCLSVCSSVRWRISKTTFSNFTKFFVNVTVARSYLDDVDHLHPALSMTYCDIVGTVGHLQMKIITSHTFPRRNRQGKRRCSTLSSYTMAANCTPGTKSATPDCLVNTYRVTVT